MAAGRGVRPEPVQQGVVGHEEARHHEHGQLGRDRPGVLEHHARGVDELVVVDAGPGRRRLVHDDQLVDASGVVLQDPGRSRPSCPCSWCRASSWPTTPCWTGSGRTGRHLVLGPRTGYGDAEGRARVEVKPGRLAEQPGCATRSSPTCAAAAGGDAGRGVHALVRSGGPRSTGSSTRGRRCWSATATRTWRFPGGRHRRARPRPDHHRGDAAEPRVRHRPRPLVGRGAAGRMSRQPRR